MGDGVDTGSRHVDTHPDAREGDLVAIVRVFDGEGRFQGGAIPELDSRRGILDCGIGGEPERLAWEVGREDDRLRGVETLVDAGERTHVGGAAAIAGGAGADRLGQAQVERSPMGVLVPGGEAAVALQVGAGVHVVKGRHRRLPEDGGECQRDRASLQFAMHDLSLLQ
ncbi:hypothetical protein D9M69_376150 [compost metagenome]